MPRARPSFFRKLLKWSSIAIALIVLVPYFSLLAMLEVGEWMAGEERPLHESIFSHTTEPHAITLIDDGPTSFAKRIEIIEGASSTLELEFFIYELDLSSRLITQKLVEKAQQGVKVRLLVDASVAVVELGPIYADYLRRHGIEVRYYNTSPVLQFFTSQHRSHRKLLIADDRIVMTGGRNIGDDYFHLSSSFNFLDSDVVVEGPIVSRVRETFDMYWNSDLASVPQRVEASAEEATRARRFVEATERDEKLFAFVQAHSWMLLSRLRRHTCTDLTFTTDFPGISESNRRVFQVLARLYKEAQREILGETPYFVIREPSIEILEDLSRRNVRTTVLTNSLASTDAFYAVSALYATLHAFEHTALNLYAYDGTPAEPLLDLPIELSDDWGVHSKRAVIDGKTIVIGTYNIDPRSAVLNSEILFVCRDNRELAAEMARDIRSRLDHARVILADNELHATELLRSAPIEDLLKFVLALPLVNSFDFLL